MEGIALNLADLLGGSRFEREAPKPRALPEAQIMELQAAFTTYSAPCPFKPGDIVVPRPNAPYTDKGVPHIVLEVADYPIRLFDVKDVTDCSSSAFGQRLDCRVAVISDDGCIHAFWQESWKLERYTGEGAPAAAESPVAAID